MKIKSLKYKSQKKKLISSFTALILASIFTQTTAKENITGSEIIKKQIKLHRTKTEYEFQKMILIDTDGSKEVRDIKRYTKDYGGHKYKALVSFIGPATIKGTAILTWMNGSSNSSQWMYFPALKKIQRIATTSKKSYFLGTDYTYEDLELEKVENFSYKILNIEFCNTKKQHKCYFIEAIPSSKVKYKKSAYKRRVMAIRSDIFITINTKYFDKRDRLIKTQFSSDWYKVGKNAWRAKKTLMINHKTNHKTLIGSVDLKINQIINDKIFSKNYILKEKHIN